MSTKTLVLVNIAGNEKKPQALPPPPREEEQEEEEQGEKAPVVNPKGKGKEEPEEDE